MLRQYDTKAAASQEIAIASEAVAIRLKTLLDPLWRWARTQNLATHSRQASSGASLDLGYPLSSITPLQTQYCANEASMICMTIVSCRGTFWQGA
ncbi:hypothetical protein [Ktedonospora formicarum]|uniref:hypothetical protein n=1 Tax=Ktedonospora formicarum TaxID=2778364 RepID=UPI001C688E6D|nr:hypothetical protein [Ktedonospora formicarum]